MLATCSCFTVLYMRACLKEKFGRVTEMVFIRSDANHDDDFFIYVINLLVN